MPDLDSFEKLSLVGMEIDRVTWQGERIVAKFGSGFRATAVTGAVSGKIGWSITSGCLPGDEDYGNLIDGLPRWDYYTQFIERHTTGGKDVFEIEYRGKRYHAAFAEDGYDGGMFSYDLFGDMTVQLEYARVAGVTYWPDGSIVYPGNIPEAYSYHIPNTYSVAGWPNSADNTNNPFPLGTVSGVAVDGDPGDQISYLEFDGVDDYLHGSTGPMIYEAMFLMRIPLATFPNYGGLFGASTSVCALFGDNGGTIWNNQGLGDPVFQYRLNNDIKLESAATAPMNVWGVVHVRFFDGVTLTNLQIGKHTNYATGRFLNMNLSRALLCDQPLTEVSIEYLYRYFASLIPA